MRSWFRIDPGIVYDKKIEAAGPYGLTAWLLGGAWSAGNLTDGHIPRATAHKLAPPRGWQDAIKAGLVETTEAGYLVHDYLDWNPSADEVRARSAKRVAAGRLGGKRSGDVRREVPTEPVEPPEFPELPDLRPELPPVEANAQAHAEANIEASASADAMSDAEANAQAVAVFPARARERSSPRISVSFRDSALVSSSTSIGVELSRAREDDGDGTTHPSRGQTAMLLEPAPRARQRRGVKTALSEGWAPKPDAFALGRELGFDEARVCFEGSLFRDSAKSSDRLCVRWDPAFNNWLRIARKREETGGYGKRRPARAQSAPVSDLDGLTLATGDEEDPCN